MHKLTLTGARNRLSSTDLSGKPLRQQQTSPQRNQEAVQMTMVECVSAGGVMQLSLHSARLIHMVCALTEHFDLSHDTAE